MINFMDEETDRQFLFGTEKFENVFEKLIDKIFCNTDKEDFYPRTEWNLQEGGNYPIPYPLQPDTIMIHNKKVYIIDAKYYSHSTQVQYDKHTLHSNNLYQIFTYVKNKAFELTEKGVTVSGLLLYAKTDEDIVPDNEYRMSGNMIGARTLDLNMEFEGIKKQLESIAINSLL